MNVLSRSCDGCPLQLWGGCKERYRLAKVGDIIYCPNGEPKLIDSGSLDAAKEIRDDKK